MERFEEVQPQFTLLYISLPFNNGYHWCSTLGSAYQSFEEDIKGSITIGKLADLVILSEDIEKIKPQRIRELSVDKTIVGGKVVYSL